MKQIIDLSVHNGPVDFKKLTNDVQEVFVRTSLGFGVTDKLLNEHAQGAAAAGLPVSYYHFGYPSVDKEDGSVCTDAVKEATFFVQTVNNLPKFTHLAVDLENWGANKDTALSDEDVVHWLSCFLHKVEELTGGTKCIIYSYADYLNQHLPKGHPFGQYPLWIANYSKVALPALPHGWDNYWAWQYSESGTLAGINGHVDLSKTA